MLIGWYWYSFTMVNVITLNNVQLFNVHVHYVLQFQIAHSTVHPDTVLVCKAFCTSSLLAHKVLTLLTFLKHRIMKGETLVNYIDIIQSFSILGVTHCLCTGGLLDNLTGE